MSRSLLALIACLFFHLTPMHADPAAMSASTEADPDAFILGCVNVINGDFCRCDADLVICGPDQLVLPRFYNNKNYLTGSGVGGWRMFPSLFLVVGNKKSPRSGEVPCRYALTGGRSGGIFVYSSADICDSDISEEPPLKIDIEQDGRGFCNTSVNAISGKFDRGNDRLYVTEKRCVLVLGDGTLRVYDKIASPPAPFLRETPLSSMAAQVENPEYYRLVEKRLSTGNASLFSYDTLGRLVRMEITNEKKTKPFSWMSFEYETTDSAYRVHVKASDARTLTYHFTPITLPDNTLHYLLKCVEGSHCVPRSYEYELRDGFPFLSRESHPEGAYLAIGYDETGKVAQLRSPSSNGQESVVTHTFSYGSSFTDVHNAAKIKTRFRYDAHQRLTHVEKYDRNDTIYRTDGKQWDAKTGRLVAVWISDSRNCVHSYRSFNYDANGNRTTEKLYGNITGKGKCPQLDHNNMILKGHGEECDTTQCTYSGDGLNLMIGCIDVNGIETCYHYVPGTSLLGKKFVHMNGKWKRAFYAYNEDGVRIETVEDDNGQTPDLKNMSGVSERRITTMRPKRTLPTVGLPITIEERMLDLDTGKKVLFRKTVTRFDDFGNFISCESYDGKGALSWREEATYNKLGKQTFLKNKVGKISHCTYDGSGRLISNYNETEKKTTCCHYDACDRIIRAEETSGGVTKSVQHSYDLLGRRISSTDETGNVASYAYDEFDRLIEVQEPPMTDEAGNTFTPTARYGYDIFNNMTSITDQDGRVTREEYTLRGLPYLGFDDSELSGSP